MRMSDIVARHIMDMLDEQQGNAEIQRNELANLLGCVPSQINYVITSRFTPEQGYIVESRRGGGGYIRITRVKMSRNTAIMHIVNSIGNEIDNNSAVLMVKNMTEQEMLSDDLSLLMSIVVSDRSLIDVPKDIRNTVRATLLKKMLLTQVM